jgi:hypothetical protein
MVEVSGVWAKQVCYAGDDDCRSPATQSNKRSAKNLKLMHECERTLKLARKNLKNPDAAFLEGGLGYSEKEKIGGPKLKINVVINFAFFPCLLVSALQTGMSGRET